MPPEEVIKKDLSYEESIRKDERQKVYEDIIELCEYHKKKLMNLSIPMRERSIIILNDIIGYCCKHETDNESEEVSNG